MNKLKYLIFIISGFISTNVLAGKDPITIGTVTKTGSIENTEIGSSSVAIYNFPVTNNTGFNIPVHFCASGDNAYRITGASEIPDHENCFKQQVSANTTKTVSTHLVFEPTTIGNKKTTIILRYGSDAFNITCPSALNPCTISADGIAPADPSTKEVVGSVLQGGIPHHIHSIDTKLKFEFLNQNSINDATIISRSVSVTYSGSGTDPDITLSGCTGIISKNNSRCLLTTTLTHPNDRAAQTATIIAELTYKFAGGENKTVSLPHTAKVVTSAPTTGRRFTFENQCSYDVDIGIFGGAIDSRPCKTQSDCPANTTCNTSQGGGKGRCNWNQPTTVSGNPTLPAKNGNTVSTAEVYFPQEGNTIIPPPGGVPSAPQSWSGNIFAHTNCSGPGGCTAPCNSENNNGPCDVGGGLIEPFTRLEVTLSPIGNKSSDEPADNYNLSMINGFNVPISMGPDGQITTATQDAVLFCNTTGGKDKIIPTNPTPNNSGLPSLGGCDWNFTPPLPPNTSNGVTSAAFVWVAINGSTTNCSSCASGESCGYRKVTKTINGAATNTLEKACGKFLGYFSGDTVCDLVANDKENELYTAFNCGVKVPSLNTIPGLENATVTNIYRCDPVTSSPALDSCYKKYPTNGDLCCGCFDWGDSFNITRGNNPIIPLQTCSSTGLPEWTSTVKPTIDWLKMACPTSYVYPFDDATSGFGCSNTIKTVDNGNVTFGENTMNYKVVFCPENA